MRSAEAETFVKFAEEIEVFDLLANTVIFRGQAVKGNLIPSVTRTAPNTDSTDKEKNALEQLSLMGASFLQGQQSTSLDSLVTAQHFGLKTRLLDWTSNPLVALWFACSDTLSGDTFVYALEADNLQAENVYQQDPFASAKTRVFQPRLNNPRVIAQHGWFTLHRYSKKARRFVPLNENPETAQQLTEIHIPAESRDVMLSALERHGISYRTIFPDLNGLCLDLNRKYML